VNPTATATGRSAQGGGTTISPTPNAPPTARPSPGGSLTSASGGGQVNMPVEGGHTLGGVAAGAVGSTRRAAATSGGASGEPDPAEIRRRRLAFLEKMQKSPQK